MSGALNWRRNISRHFTSNSSTFQPLSPPAHINDDLIFSKKGLLHSIWLKCRQIAPVISPFLNIFEVFYTGSGAVEAIGDKDKRDEE